MQRCASGWTADAEQGDVAKCGRWGRRPTARCRFCGCHAIAQLSRECTIIRVCCACAILLSQLLDWIDVAAKVPHESVHLPVCVGVWVRLPGFSLGSTVLGPRLHAVLPDGTARRSGRNIFQKGQGYSMMLSGQVVPPRRSASPWACTPNSCELLSPCWPHLQWAHCGLLPNDTVCRCITGTCSPTLTWHWSRWDCPAGPRTSAQPGTSHGLTAAHR